MSKIIKNVAIILSSVLLAFAVGCALNISGGNMKSVSGNSSGAIASAEGTKTLSTVGNGGYMEYNVSADVTGTIHERRIGATAYKVVDNGVCDYKIVTTAEIGSDIMKAVTEFNMFFEEATGIRLSVINDTGLHYDANAHYISLGKTRVFQTAGISIDYQALGNNGYQILTKGRSIFISGEERGVLYGTYDVLKSLVGFKNYTPTYYVLNKNVKDVSLPDFNIKEVPDFDYRVAPHGNYSRNQQVLPRMRMDGSFGSFIEDVYPHSAFTVLPLEKYYSSHPKWYKDNSSGEPEQLCYTAHGNSSEYTAMVNEAVERCKYFINKDQNFEHVFFAFTQNDNTAWCKCSSCSRVISQNGQTNAATQILFINDVAAKVETWLKSDAAGSNKNREIKFLIFAYFATEQAPTKKNADGTWSLINSNMRLRDNVGVWVAPIRANYLESIYSSANKDLKDLIDSWTPVTSLYAVWGYDTYFNSYLTPFDSWNTMQDLAKYLYKVNTRYYWPQGIYNDLACTNFDNLRSFIWSELLWNVNVDVNALIDEYFNAVYKEAGEVMASAFWQMRAELLRHRVELNRPYDIYTITATEEYYSQRYLVDIIETIESARDYISKYELLDKEYYDIVMKEITLETCGPKYILLKVYGTTYNQDDYRAMISDFTNCVNSVSLTKESEKVSLEEFLKKLK